MHDWAVSQVHVSHIFYHDRYSEGIYCIVHLDTLYSSVTYLFIRYDTKYIENQIIQSFIIFFSL